MESAAFKKANSFAAPNTKQRKIFLNQWFDAVKIRGSISAESSIASLVVFVLIEKYCWTPKFPIEDSKCVYLVDPSDKNFLFNCVNGDLILNIISDKEFFYLIFDLQVKFNHYVVASLQRDELKSCPSIREDISSEERNSLIAEFLPEIAKVVKFLTDPIQKLDEAKCSFPKIENKNIWSFKAPATVPRSRHSKKNRIPASFNFISNQANTMGLNDAAKLFGVIVMKINANYCGEINDGTEDVEEDEANNWPVPIDYQGERFDLPWENKLFVLSFIQTPNYFFLVLRYRLVILEGKEYLRFICAKRIPKSLVLSFQPGWEAVDMKRINLITNWVDNIVNYILNVNLAKLSKSTSSYSSISSVESTLYENYL